MGLVSGEGGEMVLLVLMKPCPCCRFSRCMQITGKEGDELLVSGAWLIRGQSIQPMQDANDDANW